MAHNLSEEFKKKLENTQGEQLLTFVKVYWGDGSIVYSEQEVLFDGTNNQFSYPGLINIDSFKTSLKLNDNGTVISFNITLDDSDGHLRTRFNREILNGTRVDILLNFAGLKISDALLIGVGTINSDNISWDESLRVLGFGVENLLISKSVSFKPYPDMINGQSITAPENYVPFVFGSPKGVPAFIINGGMKALVTHTRVFTGVKTPAPPAASPTFSTAYIVDSYSGYILDTSYDIGFFDFQKISDNAELKNPLTGQIHRTSNKGYIFVEDHMVDEFTDVNLVPFNVVDDPDDVAPGGTNFVSFLYWWVDLDPAIYDLSNDSVNSLPSYLDFEDYNGRASLFSYKVLEHVETPVASGKYRIKISHQPRWGTKEQKRDPSTGNTYSEWWSSITVDSTTGEFPKGIKIRARASYVKHSWNVNLLNYTQVLRDGTKNDEDSSPLIREELKVSAESNRASLVVTSSADIVNTNSITYTVDWLPEGKASFIPDLTTYIWQLKDATGYDVKEDGMSLDSFPSIHEGLMIPEDRTITTGRYITNIFTAGIAQIDPIDISVRAETSISLDRIPVPTGDLEITHTALIPNEALKVTQLTIDPPLEYFRFEGYYSGKVFVDHTTAFLAHDGKGGVIDLDTENAVDVINWLFSVYTNLTVLTDQANFLDIRDKVSQNKMSFYINKEVDAITLANTIAWEHKLALVFFNNTVRVVDLNKEPKIKHDFNVSNSQLKSYVQGFVPTSQVITDFRFKYNIENSNEDTSDVIIFNNNITRYGKNTQFINVLTLNNRDDVFDLIKFWGNRLSRAWRIVNFKASIEALKLQPYDAVTFNIPTISSRSITGFIRSITYEPNNSNVSVDCILASEASDTISNSQAVTDPTYWTGLQDLKIDSDKRLGIVSDLDGARLQKFSLSDLNTLRPFERRI